MKVWDIEAVYYWMQVLMAAEAANAREFIDRLPEGYHTKVGG